MPSERVAATEEEKGHELQRVSAPAHRPPCPHSISTASACVSMHTKHAGGSASAAMSVCPPARLVVDADDGVARKAGAGPGVALCEVVGAEEAAAQVSP